MPTNLLSPTLARWLGDHHGVVTTRSCGPPAWAERPPIGCAAAACCAGSPAASSPRRWPRRRWSTGAACCVACIPTASSRDRRPACSRACAANRRRRVCTSRSVTACTSTTMPASCSARPRRCARATERCAPTGSSSRRSRASPSTWPPTCASSTIARWSSSCSTGGSSPSMSWWRSVGASAIRPAAAARPSGRTCSASAAKLSDSHPEVVLHDALRALGVPVDAQVPVRCPADGVTIHVDLAVPAVRWGIELDIHPEHRSVDGHQRDSRRVRGAARRGLADRTGLRTRHGVAERARRRARRAVSRARRVHPSVGAPRVERRGTRSRFDTRVQVDAG